jgi:hypothetical protein
MTFSKTFSNFSIHKSMYQVRDYRDYTIIIARLFSHRDILPNATFFRKNR